MTPNPRMGKMKLGSFAQSHPTNLVTDAPSVNASSEASTPAPPQTKEQTEKLATVNIKIRKDQQRWLQDTSQQVRDNSSEPQPPPDRVYPQHLIGVAIDLLRSQALDWENIKTADDLRKHLSL